MSAILFNMLELPALPGNLYLPNGDTVRGGVMCLHGSEGGGMGFHDLDAQFLAAHGYAALAFTWCASARFPVEGAPDAVADIDLGKTMDAFRMLKALPEMAGKRAGIYGVSRGAEQALILATLSAQNPRAPKPDAVAVHAASDTYVLGYSFSFWRGLLIRLRRTRAWQFEGHDVGADGQPIPIELFDGPVFLSHGMLDTLWTVDKTQRLEARLKQNKRPVEVQYFANEGHILSTRGLHEHRARVIDFFRGALG